MARTHRFGLYYPKEGRLNLECTTKDIEYEYIGSLQAENLVCATYRANSVSNPEFAEWEKRDIVVGDILTCGDCAYMLMRKGLKMLKSKGKLGRHILRQDKEIIELLSSQKNSIEDYEELI